MSVRGGEGEMGGWVDEWGEWGGVRVDAWDGG